MTLPLEFVGPPQEGEVAGGHTEALQRASHDAPPASTPLPPIHPDQVHVGKERVDSMLRSAYLESTNGTATGATHAIQDHKAAIREADRFGGAWATKEEKALLQTQESDGKRHEALAGRFETRLDQLSPDLRHKINNLRFPLVQDLQHEGAQAWTKHAGEVKQIKSLLPPDMQKMFSQMSANDFRDDKTANALGEVRDLQLSPVETRLLAAREFARQDKIEDSQNMLNEVLRLKPELGQSSTFAEIFENPKILSENLKWNGPAGASSASGVQVLRGIIRNELQKMLQPDEEEKEPEPEKPTQHDI